MKPAIDEKLKHRLIGLLVVLSLGAIFLPAMMKKSSQRLEHHLTLNVQLPPKPKAPNVVITDEKEMFQTIKVAQLNTPLVEQKDPVADKENFLSSMQGSDEKLTPLAKTDVEPDTAAVKPIELALSVSDKKAINKQVGGLAKKSLSASAKVNSTQKPQKLALHQPINTNPLNKKGMYAVQLASFANLSNAQALVNKLHAKGYTANYVKAASGERVIYKVYVGYSPIKSDVMKLKTQLASAMQMNGLVVNTGVS